jgi:hypothetical protein
MCPRRFFSALDDLSWSVANKYVDVDVDVDMLGKCTKNREHFDMDNRVVRSLGRGRWATIFPKCNPILLQHSPNDLGGNPFRFDQSDFKTFFHIFHQFLSRYFIKSMFIKKKQYKILNPLRGSSPNYYCFSFRSLLLYYF